MNIFSLAWILVFFIFLFVHTSFLQSIDTFRSDWDKLKNSEISNSIQAGPYGFISGIFSRKDNTESDHIPQQLIYKLSKNPLINNINKDDMVAISIPKWMHDLHPSTRASQKSRGDKGVFIKHQVDNIENLKLAIMEHHKGYRTAADAHYKNEIEKINNENGINADSILEKTKKLNDEITGVLKGIDQALLESLPLQVANGLIKEDDADIIRKEKKLISDPNRSEPLPGFKAKLAEYVKRRGKIKKIYI